MKLAKDVGLGEKELDLSQMEFEVGDVPPLVKREHHTFVDDKGKKWNYIPFREDKPPEQEHWDIPPVD